MRIRFLYLAILAASVFASCKKEAVETTGNTGTKTSSDSQSNAAINPIEGKWQETKLVLQMTDQAGVKIGDTVYTKQLLASDYAQFNIDGSCILSQAQVYSTNGIQGVQYSNLFNITKQNSTTILNYSGPVGTMGFPGPDTLYTSDINTVQIHSVAYLMNGNVLASDAYYTR